MKKTRFLKVSPTCWQRSRFKIVVILLLLGSLFELNVCFANNVHYTRSGNVSPGTRHFAIISYDYAAKQQQAKHDIKRLIHMIRDEDPITAPNYLNTLIKKAGGYFINKHIPYSTAGVQGEGDWCSANKRGCGFHVKQDLVYRTDHFDCNTFVQTVLALIDAKNLRQYHKNILRINYGIATMRYPYRFKPTTIAYYNRNNFMSGDLNPVNQRSGLFWDATSLGPFASMFQLTHAKIDRASWFAHQASLKGSVRVLPRYKKLGAKLVAYFQRHYGQFYSPEQVYIDYIPKSVLARQTGNNYVPNTELINQIPAPAVIEIIRDDSKWTVNGVPIQTLLHSGINVSHVAFIYRQHFNLHDIIYQKTTCQNTQGTKTCTVTPVFCTQSKGCLRTMMLAATDAYPNQFIWSLNRKTGCYSCSATVPHGATQLTTCNRVMAMPLGAYLTRYMYGIYRYMIDPSILGIHVEALSIPHA